MRRRAFITLLAGAAAWPLVAQGQQAAMPVIGFLRSTSLADATHIVTAFREGLKEAGLVEGRNVAIEFGSAEGQPERLQALVADLSRRPVDVIVGNPPSARVAKAATGTMPIVFAGGSDPVRDGLVASLNRPGGNVTGVIFFTGVLGAKRLIANTPRVPIARRPIASAAPPSCTTCAPVSGWRSSWQRRWNATAPPAGSSKLPA